MLHGSTLALRKNWRLRQIPADTYATPTLAYSNPSTWSGETAVEITGTDLLTTVSVYFGTLPAVSFTVDADDQVTAVAPEGSSTDVIVVSTLGGSAVLIPPGDLPLRSFTAQLGTEQSYLGNIEPGIE